MQQNEAYLQFCSARPHLFHLTLDSRLANKFITQKRGANITNVLPGDIVHVDIRFFGDQFYESLNLPDFETSVYVDMFKYTKWFHKGKSKRHIVARFKLTKQVFRFDNCLVYCWGSAKDFNKETMILMDMELASTYPRILIVDGPVDNSDYPSSPSTAGQQERV